jgi:uncharacterized protein with FMN-binding domain
MAKMNKKWIALCSTAIAAVYAAGYMTTETQASMAQPKPLPQVQVGSNGGQSQDSASDSSAPSSAPSYSVPPSSVPSPASLYKDGTYTGMGSNRRGYIQVTVTIKKDKITDVTISDFAMHYSESDVVGLPSEVLQNQSANVQNVSGATYSTQAFVDAVQAAISQAQNA